MFKLGNLEVNSLKKRNVYDKQVNDYREQHTIEIRNIETGISESFEYTTQTLNYIPKDKNKVLENALWSIFMDYNIYQNCENEFDFIEEFGYPEEEGEKIYKLSEDNSIRFYKLLDDETIELLSKYYENY